MPSSAFDESSTKAKCGVNVNSTRTIMDRAHLKSPLGIIEIRGSESGIRSVSFTDLKEPEDTVVSDVLSDCLLQLLEYFQGQRRGFSVRLDPEGSEFQHRVWQQLQQIPFGETLTYLEQAEKLGDIKAIRAVAAANARNPIAVIIPCHRVVGSDGSLTGYAGGLWRKRWLLDHENPPSQTRLFQF